MRLVEDTIITLDDNQKYVYVNECIYENKRYVLVMGVQDDNKTLIPHKILIVEEVEENGNMFIDIVTDQDLIIRLARMLKGEDKK